MPRHILRNVLYTPVDCHVEPSLSFVNLVVISARIIAPSNASKHLSDAPRATILR